MNIHDHLATAQLAAADCSLTSKRIITLLDNPNTRPQVGDEIKQLQKDFTALLHACDALGITP